MSFETYSRIACHFTTFLGVEISSDMAHKMCLLAAIETDNEIPLAQTCADYRLFMNKGERYGETGGAHTLSFDPGVSA